MAQINRFEDIEAWKRARELTKKIYACTQVGAFARDFGLKDQIRRAAVSVMSNIAEGFERGGNGEFVQFLAMSKGSCGEVRCQLYAAFDQNYLDQLQFDELFQESEEISRMISGFIAYLKQTELRGTKYKS